MVHLGTKTRQVRWLLISRNRLRGTGQRSSSLKLLNDKRQWAIFLLSLGRDDGENYDLNTCVLPIAAELLHREVA
jgi:hypothetical protein